MNGFADEQNFHRHLHRYVRTWQHAVTQCVALVPVIVLRSLLLRFQDLVDQIDVYQTTKLSANCSVLNTDVVFSLLLREISPHTVYEKLFKQII